MVAIVATGGTIANTGERRLAVSEVLEDIERAGHSLPDASFRIIDVLRESAATLTPAKWVEVWTAVDTAVQDPDVVGVVVTHGTFTAEETAYFLHLTVRSEKPVALACAQRLHGSVGNDGDQNLLDAVRVVLTPEAAGLGTVLTYNEEIHCAREVLKISGRLNGFTSQSMGILGTVDLDKVSIYRRPTRRSGAASEFDLGARDVLPRVDIVPAYPGADATAIRAFIDAGAKGLVVDGFAYSGRPFDDQVPALADAVRSGIPVVKVNRGRDGRIPFERKEPFVRGDNLTAGKARVLLSLAVMHSTEVGEIQRIFDEY